VCDVPDERLGEAMQRLEEIGYPVFGSPFRTGAMACTGIEFCKLSIVETKGRMRWLYTELERRLPDLDEPIRINVNGCPNSCARYQLADIGFMGVLVTEKTKDDGTIERLEGFNVHLGGHLGAERAFGRKQRGIRLRADELVSFTENLIGLYRDRRNGHGSFGEWLNSHDEAGLNALSRKAAAGLARVGPIPLAVEEVRPDLDAARKPR
jgi:sulfite reductase (ferredoxin)